MGKEGEVSSRSSVHAYTTVTRNKPKIIQAVSRQGVLGNQLAMRPQARDHSGGLVQLPSLQWK